MRDLLNYLWAGQFFEDSGNPHAGRRVFTAKRCAVSLRTTSRWVCAAPSRSKCASNIQVSAEKPLFGRENLSTRTPAGWQVKLLTPPQAPFPSYNPTSEPNPDPFFAFNSNLTETVFDTYGSPPVVAGEPADSNNLYTENPVTGSR